MQSIAIVAPMHSGKTTLANFLVERGYVKMAFADALKATAVTILNDFLYTWQDYLPDRWDGERGRKIIIPIDRQELEDAKAVFRPFLQWLGTEFREYLKNDSLWIEILSAKIALSDRPVVIDDVRFPREADALRGLGFRIVRLTRPEEDRIASLRSVGLSDAATLRHASETDLESIVCDAEYGANSLEGLKDIAYRLTRDDRLAPA